jgi:hypothetical protein
VNKFALIGSEVRIMNLLRRMTVLVAVAMALSLLANGSWSQQPPGQGDKKEQPPVPGKDTKKEQPPVPGKDTQKEQPPVPGKDTKKEQPPVPGKDGKKEVQPMPQFSKIELPQAPLFYRSPRTQILLQSGGPKNATFGMVVSGTPPTKESVVFEFANYDVVGAEISFAGSRNRYKGWFLSAAGAKNLPQYIFVSDEINKSDPRQGYPVGFWEVNPQTGQPAWMYKVGGLRLPYRGQPFPANPK